MRRSFAAILTATTAACAGGSGPSAGGAPAPAQAPAVTTVMQQAAQAAAPVPEKPKDIDPTGTYSVALTYQGQPITITLHLAKAEGGRWTGTVLAEGIPAMSLLGTTVAGNKVTAGMTTPDGAAVQMTFTIVGDELSGSWRSPTDGSTMTGKKLP